MIQVSTRLAVADNSGALVVQCIKVLKGFHCNQATLGDLVVVAIKKSHPHGKLKKGDVHKAVVVRTKKATHCAAGHALSFADNAVVLVNHDGAPLGTRVFGPVSRRLKARQYFKILALAPVVY